MAPVYMRFSRILVHVGGLWGLKLSSLVYHMLHVVFAFSPRNLSGGTTTFHILGKFPNWDVEYPPNLPKLDAT